MLDLLYYYCGGRQESVAELAVSLHSLLKTNPTRRFQVGIALDDQAAAHLNIRRIECENNVTVRVIESSPQSSKKGNGHAHHVINRWNGLRLFDYDRAVILDIDTIVNRSLEELFDLIHPNPTFFTTFAHFTERVRKWNKHRRFYDAANCEYDTKPLYCGIGMHAISCDWPYVRQIIDYCSIMDAFKRRHHIRRAFIEEYSINLLLLQNGRKVHFPFSAISKPRTLKSSVDQAPHVWHFILGRCRSNALWQRSLEEIREVDFLGLSAIL